MNSFFNSLKSILKNPFLEEANIIFLSNKNTQLTGESSFILRISFVIGLKQYTKQSKIDTK